MTSLCFLDHESIGNIVHYLHFPDIWRLELIGSRVLTAKVLSSTRSLYLSFHGLSIPEWPRFVAKYHRLTRLYISNSYTVQHWPICGVNLTILPKTLVSLEIRGYDALMPFVGGLPSSKGYNASGIFDFAEYLPNLTSLGIQALDLNPVVRLTHFPPTLTELTLRTSKNVDFADVLHLFPRSLRRLVLTGVAMDEAKVSNWKRLPDALETLDVTVYSTELAWISMLPVNLNKLEIMAIGDRAHASRMFKDLPRQLTAFSWSGETEDLQMEHLEDLPKTLTSFSWDGWTYDGIHLSEAIIDSLPTSLKSLVLTDHRASPNLMIPSNMHFWNKFVALDLTESYPLSCALPSTITDLKFRSGILQLDQIAYLPRATLQELELADINDNLAIALFPSLSSISRLAINGGRLSTIGASAIPSHSTLSTLSVITGLFTSLDAISALPPTLNSLILSSTAEASETLEEHYLRSPLAPKLLPKGLERVFANCEDWMTIKWATALLERQQELAKEIQEDNAQGRESSAKTLKYLAFSSNFSVPEDLIPMLPETLQTFRLTCKLTDPETTLKGLPRKLRDLSFSFPRNFQGTVINEHLLHLPRHLYELTIGDCGSAINGGANKFLPPNLYKLTMGRVCPIWFKNHEKFAQMSRPIVE